MGGVKRIALLTAVIMILSSISSFAVTDLQGQWSE